MTYLPNQQDFIASLEVDAEIAFGRFFYLGDRTEPRFQFSKVFKITPSGQIKTTCGKVFNPNGTMRGSSSDGEKLVNPELARDLILKHKQEQQAKTESIRKELHDLVDKIEHLSDLEYYIRRIKSDMRKA
jgi:chromosome segregation ATPase